MATASSAGYRPAEAAHLLGVPPSTLRLYSVRFASLLSPSAAQPVERGGGRPGYRIYTARDLDVLRDGKSLLERGLTYDEALEELSERWRPVPRRLRQPERSPRDEEENEPEAPEAAAVSAAVAASGPLSVVGAPAVGWPAREEEWRTLVGSLLRGLNSAQTLAEEWRRISEERAEEIAALREQLRIAEEEARKPWWRRLFG